MSLFTGGVKLFGGRRRSKDDKIEVVGPEPHYSQGVFKRKAGPIVMAEDEEEREEVCPSSLPKANSSFRDKMTLFVQTCSPRTPRTPHDHDWDAEARELFLRLNLEHITEERRHKYRNLDAIYAHPVTSAKLYIGNQTAARSESVLVGEQVFDIVNCQDEHSTNFFEHDPRFRYKRFPVANWFRKVENIHSHDDILQFFESGCHLWIEDALAKGRNVLVHCLAGAHRAGTVGVSMMMRQGHFDVSTAIRLAKFQRPIVDPFGPLLDLLNRLQAAYESRGDIMITAISKLSVSTTHKQSSSLHEASSFWGPSLDHATVNTTDSIHTDASKKTSSSGRHIHFESDNRQHDDILSPTTHLKLRKAAAAPPH